MKLAIADPPYLGVAHRWYGASGEGAKTFGWNKRMSYRISGDEHPDASDWDDPETHRAMVERLRRDYDGWAVAMRRQNLAAYLPWVGEDIRICVWHKLDAVPSGQRVRTSWEPVIVSIPPQRRKHGTGLATQDVLRCPINTSHMVGAKPLAWTRWLLDMLGYRPDEDTVEDLFHGNGNVSAAIAQMVLDI